MTTTRTPACANAAAPGHPRRRRMTDDPPASKDEGDARVLACLALVAGKLQRLDPDATTGTAGSLHIAASILWARLDDNQRAAWLDRWDFLADALRDLLANAALYDAANDLLRRLIAEADDDDQD
jgi:hypothetical protein